MTRPDPREVPAYAISDAAHYLGIPTATLRAWVLGRKYPIAGGFRKFEPVIEIADAKTKRLSFFNLVESHVLSAIRKDHNISLGNVRKALKFLKTALGLPRPLADKQFETDGVDLFVEELGRLINISRDGQLAMAEIIKMHLKRVRRDQKGAPLKLYLFTRSYMKEPEPIAISIDPRISFGRPVIDGTRIPTAVLAERYKAGDSIRELAQDYGAKEEAIEEAIRCELQLKAA